jgi:hypothetical protein
MKTPSLAWRGRRTTDYQLQLQQLEQQQPEPQQEHAPGSGR